MKYKQIIPVIPGLHAEYRKEDNSIFSIPVEFLALDSRGEIVGFTAAKDEGFWFPCEFDENFIGYIRKSA